MEYNEQNIFYAREGEYVTLTGQPYIGAFHKMPSGALMTGTGHSADSEVIVATANRRKSKTPPLQTISPNTDLNENDTVYDLLPVLANKPPVITKPIADASTPSVKPYAAARTSLQGDHMYLFPDGTVKVHAGTTIVLRIEAEQPDVFNVENGVLEIIPPKTELTYRWNLDGENIVANDAIPELRSSRIVSGNTLTIKNICPQFAGTYGCVVSNDIGATDGGSINLEVFNSDFDSFFYTNLIQNPNGRVDGELSVDNWNTVGGDVISRKLIQKSNGFRDKRIAVDPMNPDFRWTKEMLHPKPYQLDGGTLQNNPLKNLNSYFSKENHEYLLNGGSNTLEVYQDVDLSEIQNQINGSIYGVGGVRAIVSFYLGMAIHNYIPAWPNITPDRAADIGFYNIDSPRISFQNFFKMGPGFVQEKIYVEIEEYDREERLLSLDSAGRPRKVLERVLDPWNSRVPKYRNQSYTDENGTAISTSPDRRDSHLYIIDELVPNIADRYAYGQYAEFHKIEIPFLNPKTNKIRINFTIEVMGNLGFAMQETKYGLPVTSLRGGLFAYPGWQGTYKRDDPSNVTNDPSDERQISEVIRNEYRTSAAWPDSVEQRVPKSPLSKAFATGFNLCLIPNEIGKEASIRAAIENIYTQNEVVKALVPGPIVDKTISTDIETKHIDVSFGLIKDENKINIKVQTYDPSKPTNKATEQYIPGLFPFLPSSITTVPSAPTIEGSSNLNTNPPGGLFNNMVKTNGLLSPIYIQPIEDQLRTRYTQLHDKALDKGVTNKLFDPNPTIAPRFPIYWYSLRDVDKLNIYKTGSVSTDALQKYAFWAVPGSELNYRQYIESWNNGPFSSGVGFFKPQIDERETTWMQESRFVVTLGVHNVSESIDSTGSLYAVDNYYLDCRADEAIIHKTPNLGGVEYLPSFDSFEFPSANDISNLADPSATTAFAVQGLTPEDNTSTTGTKVYKSFGSESINMKPVIIDIEKAAGSQTTTAGIPLPDEFLTRSRLQGGLGIPMIDVDGSGSMAPDPNYKVCLYGVRPATLANKINGFETAREGADVVFADSFVGTPLSGEDASRNVEYVVKNIKIEQIEMDSGGVTDPDLDYTGYTPTLD